MSYGPLGILEVVSKKERRPSVRAGPFSLSLLLQLYHAEGNSSASLAEERSAVVSIVCPVLQRYRGVDSFRPALCPVMEGKDHGLVYSLLIHVGSK